MRPNRLRELLRNGRLTLGTHLHTMQPSLVELVGRAGTFDYVELLGEYSPYDLYALDNLGRAIELFDHLTGMIKIDQQPRTYLAARAISAGVQNVLFADIRTVADAEECVRSVRAESPGSGGVHGVSMGRNVGIVLEPGSADFVQALDDAVIALMIEKKSAVENLEAILSVRGVDMVQFGPADYAMSIGLAGQRDHPQVREAERYVIETCLKRGIPPRAEITHPRQANRYVEMGVRHFCVGTDVAILFDWFKENGRAMRDLLTAS